MYLSKLQRYILKECYFSKNRAKLKVDFYDFYPKKELKTNKIAVQAALQNSLDNLVAKDLVAAYGHKTAKKWFIYKIKLTGQGRRLAKKLIKNRQGKLPIK